MKVKEFLSEENGMGTVEVVLIIVVLISLVLIFKNQITTIVNDIFKKVKSESKKV